MRFGKAEKRQKSKKSRTTVCIIITAAIFAGFAIRLVDWQLVQGKSYKSLAAKSTGYTEKPTQQGAKSLTATVEVLL